MFNFNLDLNEIKNKINKDGFYIVSDFIEKELIRDLKDFWIQRLHKLKTKNKHVGGNLYLGENNFTSFSDTKSLTLYRHFDFLWNKEENELSRKLNIEVHKLRNKLQDFEENTGLEYSSDCFGFYISTSYYPSNIGKMGVHIDEHKERDILQYMIPLTFKGKDYDDGGLFVMDKNNKWQDIDARCNPGSLIFFNGKHKHKVELIKSKNKNKIGRIAVFSIPTYFLKDTKFPVFKRSFKILNRELFDLPIYLSKNFYKLLKK